MRARSAQGSSNPLRRARLCAAWPAETDINGGPGFVNAFLGLKGRRFKSGRPDWFLERLYPELETKSAMIVPT
jgi:hypothetical protein